MAGKLSAKAVLALMPSLMEFLETKAAEEVGLDEPEAPPEAPSPEGGNLPKAGFCDACDSNPCRCGEKEGGLGVVIAMKPKAPGGPGKVAGCPDCEEGTPHEHVK